MSIAIPRIRDFRGLKANAFDGRGNYSLGVREQTIFPEIDYDSVDAVRGLDIAITTSAKTDIEAFALFEALACRSQRKPPPTAPSRRRVPPPPRRPAPRGAGRQGGGRAGRA